MNILIVGVGFIGEPLAETLTGAGHHVIGLTHSESSFTRLSETSSADIRQADVSQGDSLKQALHADEANAIDWVIHCASSGRGGPDKYRSVYRDGLANLQRLCPQARLLYTSSTSVYGQVDGSVVDESSATEPDRETGRIRRETEEIALASGGIVARLAGIYGPGRSFTLLKYLNHTAVIEGDGGRYLNQAHGQDIVSALVHLMERDEAGVFNIVDSTSQTQLEIYQWLADHFQGELPPTAPPDYERKRGWTHKRVSNAKLQATGWSPTYPSFQESVLHDPALVPSIRKIMNADV
jgi:nucleoside-diphosphate-sugar epimerase